MKVRQVSRVVCRSRTRARHPTHCATYTQIFLSEYLNIFCVQRCSWQSPAGLPALLRAHCSLRNDCLNIAISAHRAQTILGRIFIILMNIVGAGGECAMKTSVTVWKVNTTRVIPVNPLLFEYRTAECRLDWIDLLACKSMLGCFSVWFVVGLHFVKYEVFVNVMQEFQAELITVLHSS